MYCIIIIHNNFSFREREYFPLEITFRLSVVASKVRHLDQKFNIASIVRYNLVFVKFLPYSFLCGYSFRFPKYFLSKETRAAGD